MTPFRWAQLPDSIIASLVRPPFRRRGAAALLIAAIVLTIVVLDLSTGVEISLFIFYLIPIVLATGWIGPRAGAFTALASVALRAWTDHLLNDPRQLHWPRMWNLSMGFTVYLLIVWLVHSLLSFHRKLQGQIEAQSTELRESVADRQRLELEVLDVSARERSAIGRELHDELGQHLVATAMAAQVLTQKLPDPARARDAHAIVHWLEDGIAKTRKLARGLLLAQIEPECFLEELERLAAVSSRGGIDCRLVHRGPPVRAAATQCAQLYRIAQEAVGNALRHARASLIEIVVAVDDHALCFTIEDNGEGFDPAAARGPGMGLRIMQHRAKVIGASLSLLSLPGEGTRIICRLPHHAGPLAA